MSIWILLAGNYTPPAIPIAADDTIIAVDGGICHAQQLGVTPQLWMGDFDSSHAAYADLPCLAFPTDKAQTDFELALDYAAQHCHGEAIHVIGSAGGEADHAFGNLWVLPAYAGRITLWQAQAVIVCAAGAASVQWTAAVGSKVSLFALSPLAGVSNQGLRWPCENAAIAPHTAAAARNIMSESCAAISWQSGCGLLFLPAGCRPNITMAR